MPIGWRKFYYKKTEEYFLKQKEMYDKNQSGLDFTNKKQSISKLNVDPTYTSKKSSKK